MGKKIPVLLGLINTITVLVQCSKTKDATSIADLKALPLTADAPADNVQTPQKVALGQMLFWDPILSGGKDIACATCHHPSFGFSDGLALSIGTNGQVLGTARHFLIPNTIPFAKRNSQSIINTAFNGIGPRHIIRLKNNRQHRVSAKQVIKKE